MTFVWPWSVLSKSQIGSLGICKGKRQKWIFLEYCSWRHHGWSMQSAKWAFIDTKCQGHLFREWSGGVTVSCILRHRGVRLILAYSWARPAIPVAGKGREGMFFFLLFLHFYLCSFSSLSLSFISLTISSISLLPFSGGWHKMTHKGWRVIKPQHKQGHLFTLVLGPSDSVVLKSLKLLGWLNQIAYRTSMEMGQLSLFMGSGSHA